MERQWLLGHFCLRQVCSPWSLIEDYCTLIFKKRLMGNFTSLPKMVMLTSRRIRLNVTVTFHEKNGVSPLWLWLVFLVVIQERFLCTHVSWDIWTLVCTWHQRHEKQQRKSLFLVSRGGQRNCIFTHSETHCDLLVIDTLIFLHQTLKQRVPTWRKIVYL
jgi:hypothetical protein